MLQLKAKIKTVPASLPVSIDDLRGQLRLGNDTTYDTELTRYIKSSVNWAQKSTGRHFMPTTLVGYLDQLTGEPFQITNGPVTAISSIKYYVEGTANQQTLDAEYYSLENIGLTATVHFSDEFEAPDWQARWDSVEVEFVSGWSSAEAVPEEIKDAIIMKAARLYTHPDDGVNERNTISESLLDAYKVPRL